MTWARTVERRTDAIRTFLIADIRGYTRFTAQWGDEAASQLASHFADMATEGVEAWGGTLVELRGDEALATFASARMALRAAAELQAAFAAESSYDPSLALGVGMGLDVGEAVSVADGYRGAALNLAARLCASAEAGQILASPALIHLAGPLEDLAFERRPPVALKGLAEPVAPWLVTWSRGKAAPLTVPGAVLGDGAPRSVLPPQLDPIVPLAGRQLELRWLRWHLRRAGHGDGRVAVISGVPGIGKTRLAAELASFAHSLGGEVRYLAAAEGADSPELLRWLDSGVPAVVVVDDLDAATRSQQEAVSRIAQTLTGRPQLLLIAHRNEAAEPLINLVQRITGRERRLELGPLEGPAVRAIAALYAGRSVDGLHLAAILEDSHGVPAAVHRMASRLVRESLNQRLASTVGRTEQGRSDLRSAEQSLVGEVAELEQVRSRANLYGADRELPAVTLCPYKGLVTYEGSDAEYYFGRERLVGELVARLVGSPVLGLVGASGSGKSSAVLAGLLPALAGGVLPGSENWLEIVIRPGEHPLASLAQALARAVPDSSAIEDVDARLEAVIAHGPQQRQVVLVIDQFEEVFAATRDEAERSAFIGLIARERAGLKVVVVLRADHYGHAAPYPALARALAASHVLVGPLSRSELMAVIEHPAERVGLRVEPGLAERLVADAGNEPGVLPLLSTSLLELWQGRQDGYLTLSAYLASGGLHSAVARLAESALAQMDPREQSLTRALFLRLAGQGEGEGVVRRRVSRAELDADRDPIMGAVLERLTAARLLTSGDGFVEVAHEALLREWPRVRTWLEEDAAGRQVRLHLTSAARDWESRGREPGDLYRGARLAAALEWAQNHQIELNASERDFLAGSRLVAERDAGRQRRTNRRLRTLLAATAVLLVAAIAAGTQAFAQGDEARRQAALAADREAQARVAEGQALAAQAQSSEAARQALTAQSAAQQSAVLARIRELNASAQAALSVDPSLAKLLAVAAAALGPVDLAAEGTLRRAWARDRVLDRIPFPGHDSVWSDISPAGDLLLASFPTSGSLPEQIQVMDARTHAVLWHVDPPPQVTYGRAWFSVDGRTVVAAGGWDPGNDKPVYPGRAWMSLRVWDARSGRLLHQFDAGPCGAEASAISARWVLINALQVAKASAPSCFPAQFPAPVVLVDLTSGTHKLIARSSGGDAAMSRDGRFVAVTDAQYKFSYVQDVATGRRVFERSTSAGHQLNHGVRDLSADGSMLVYGDRPIQTFDVRTGALLASLGGASGESSFAGFLPTEATVLVATRDAVIREFDPTTGVQLLAVPAVGGGHTSVSETGIAAVMDESSWTLSLVDRRLRSEGGAVQAACRRLAPAGSIGVAGGTAAFVGTCSETPLTAKSYVVNLGTMQLSRILPGSGAQDFALSPDGSRLAQQEAGTGNVLSPIRIRDVATGKLLVKLDGVCSFDQTRYEPAPPGCQPYPKSPFALWAWSMVWSPDGRWIGASNGRAPAYLAIWNATTGKLVKTVAPAKDVGWGSIIFSPDSTRLIATFSAGVGKRELVVFSTNGWTEVGRFKRTPLDAYHFSVMGGFTDAGMRLVVADSGGVYGGGWLDVIDLQTGALVRSARVQDATLKSVAVNRDGTVIATGGADGVVRLWDASTLNLLHEVSVDSAAQGVAFVDDGRLAVMPSLGGLQLFVVDRNQLLNIVRSSVTRPFTPQECAQYGFGAACPSLDQLRQGSSPSTP